MLIARLIKPHTVLYRRIREVLALVDPVFLLRPSLMFPVWIMIVAGMAAARTQKIPELYWIKSVHLETVVFFAALTLMAGSTLLRRQINTPPDGHDQTVTALGNRNMNTLDVKAWASRLMAGGLVLAAGVSVFGLVGEGKWAPTVSTVWAVLAVLTWAVLNTGDRFPGLNRRIPENVTTVSTGLFLFMVGWTYGSGPLGTGLVHAVPYALLFVAISVLAAVRGKRTGVIAALTTALTAAASVLGFILEDPVISTGSTLALPFFLVALVFSRTDHVARAVRYPILIMGFFVSIRYPWLFVALAALYYSSKIYYYFRFNLDYPTFHVDQE